MQRIAFKYIVFFQKVLYGSCPEKALHFRAHSKMKKKFKKIISRM